MLPFYDFFAGACFIHNGHSNGWKKPVVLAGNESCRPGFLQDEYCFGFITYDFKNQAESLVSKNPDYLSFGEPLKFFKAEFASQYNGDFILPQTPPSLSLSSIQCRTSREEYIFRVNELKKHIQLGNTYELNYCVEFFAEEAEIDPVSVFGKLNAMAKAPWSCLLKYGERYLISASPECFLKKRGDKISSHPIKGTAPRGIAAIEDEKLKRYLENDPKEKSENIMITDLVRNDLSKIAEKGTVKVEELCKVYSFETVHQLISEVSCRLKPGVSFEEIIRSTFPMGSMTGAPKIRSMQLIDEHENFSRGMYSGTCGYFSPDGDFDFNVIIRSILYNREKKYLSFPVGSAITAKSDPGKEYEECMLKAKAMINALTT
ncbi:MAG: anthranilate synthase component I family protein [Bacteroidota bacterium]